MLDLYNKTYDIETLKKYIYAIKFIDILKTQKINASFAVHYILNKNYQLHEEDIINEETVLYYQPHISKLDLVIENINYTQDTDVDSVEDFETVSNNY